MSLKLSDSKCQDTRFKVTQLLRCNFSPTSQFITQSLPAIVPLHVESLWVLLQSFHDVPKSQIRTEARSGNVDWGYNRIAVLRLLLLQNLWHGFKHKLCQLPWEVADLVALGDIKRGAHSCHHIVTFMFIGSGIDLSQPQLNNPIEQNVVLAECDLTLMFECMIVERHHAISQILSLLVMLGLGNPFQQHGLSGGMPIPPLIEDDKT